MKVAVWIGALAASAVVAAGGTSFAADLDPIYAPIYQDVPEVQPVEIGTGWYLRGDVGYQFKSDIDTSYSATTPAGSVSGDYDGLSLPASAEFSGGIGYKFNEFLRTDATVGYWKSHVDNVSFGAADASLDSKAEAYELMANAYVDLGTYAGFTPYLGAGAGAVHVSYETGCRYLSTSCDANFDELKTDEGSDWRFAYSLMAGVSYDVSKNLKLDVGYRFMDVDGGGVTEVIGQNTTTGDTMAISGSDDGFKRHTIQAGIRYSIW
ncbi:outer membrane protein [Jiella sonneratiae]|uniref:Porin family protein n=1 Tax=Jiella sonneratiae TaxID=2816856 RepID=A0ABS3J2W3_9HYPH|nr:outer membrane beta-barrel protein [Jiella sonneratiae]MBO0903993.1 porin family protein [Jiella sonneratiae]